MRARARRRLLALALALVGAGALALSFALPHVVRGVVERELAARGVDDARFEVRHAGVRRVVLTDVVLGSDLTVDRLAVALDPLALRVEAMTLSGARFTAAPSTMGQSTLARLLADDGAGGPAPTIRIEDATFVLQTSGGPAIVDVDGEVGSGGDGRLTLRSSLGAHRVSFRSHRDDDARVIEVAGEGSGDALLASLRVEGDDLRAEAELSLADGARTFAGRAIQTEGAHLVGAARVSDGRIDALKLRARASALVVDGIEIGDATLTANGAPIVWALSTRTAAGLEARADGTLAPDLSSPAFTWSLRGPIPASLVHRAADFLESDGEVEVALSGRAREDGASGWRVEDVGGEVRADTLRVPDAELVFDDARITLAASARIEGRRVEVEVEAGSRLLAAQMQLDALRLERLDATPVLTVVDDGEAVRVLARRPIEARMARLAIGDGDSALGFEAVDMTLSGEDGPVMEIRGPETTLAARMEARAPRIRGVLTGSRAHAVADVEVAIEGDDARIAIPLEVHAATLSEGESELSLDDVAVTLPLRWAAGEVTADGRMRAARMSWREIPIGRTSGAVRLTDDALELGWRAPATRTAHLRLDARVGLDDDGGWLRVRVPRVDVRDGDPLQRALVALTDMELEGPMEGALRLDIEHPDRGEARLVFHGADLREVEGAGAARGVRGTVRFSRLDPIETARPAHVTWTHLALGGVELDAGSARLAFTPPRHIEVRDMRVALAGGQVAVAPLRFDREEPEIALDLTIRGVELQQVLRAATEGRISGEGELDGRVALQLALGEERRILLGDGHLSSRGPGTLRVRTDVEEPAKRVALGDLIDGSFIRRRVLAAIEDFEYRRLTMNVVGEGTRHLRARVVGRGKRMPQELDLTLNFRGIQPLLDHAVRLWPSGVDASIEVGAK